MTTKAVVLAATAFLPLLAIAESESPPMFSRFYGTLGISLMTLDDAHRMSGVIEQQNKTNSLSTSVGRYFGQSNRIELAVAQSSNTFSTTFGAPFSPSNQRFKYESLHVSLNYYRTWAQRGRLSLFAGGGGGTTLTKQRQFIDYADSDLSFESSHRQRRMSFNASVNANYRLSRRVALQAGYSLSRAKGGGVNQTQTAVTLSLSVSVSPHTP
ncbi:MAG: outer membrane beta-barrel protein [Gammaproteobacteria bacterium]|nr:outer membrane beta-barrel protein [Gammaproteobacteria bacterium]MDE0269691.1 outer membrane beta-barrel protein [Gammaproteobacteria bacterium]